MMTIRKTVTTAIFIGFTICCVVLLFILPPIPQDPTYHNFADTRKIFGISNFYNVISNLPFAILGLMGLQLFFKENILSMSTIAIPTLFIGVVGIGIGSAFYHFNPNNATLVWDRIPMTITFMSFLSIIVSRYVNNKWGSAILFPLIMIGIASVIIWYCSELAGAGDLRLYALVQFYPMVAVPLIVFIYPTPSTARIKILGIIILYAIAKFFEHQDAAIFAMGKIISGHAIKHLFAAGSIFLIMRMVNEKN